MARSIEQIQAQIIAYKNAQPELSALNSTSHRSIWLLWTYIVAVAIAVHEQFEDLYIAVIEAIVARSAAATSLWIQYYMFRFQYDDTDPQIVQLINTVPQYPVIDETKYIITACSVTSDNANTVNIKVAQGNPYVELSALQITAAQSYIETIGTAGIDYNIISLSPDRIFIGATIFYQGQYSSVIKANVIAALDAYFQRLSQINFNGSIKMSDLESIVRNVTGVNDVIMNDVKGRPNTTPIAGAIYFIQANTLLFRLWNPDAGYMIQEDTAGNTFSDTLTFIAQ